MTTRCLILALLLALSVGCHAALMPGDPDRIVKAWEFDGTEAEGWKVTNNLTDLLVAEGVLTTQATGPDSNMAVSDLDLPCAELTHLVLRMKSDAPGSTQVYFATSTSGDPAANSVPSFGMRADNEWHEYEVALKDLKGFSGDLGYLRIDPVNGSESAHIGIDYIRLVEKAPRVGLIRFASDKVWTEPGATVKLTLELSALGGAPLPELTAVLSGLPGSLPVTRNTETDRYLATWEVEAPPAPGAKWHVRVSTGDKLLLVAETCALSVDKASLPTPSGRLRVTEENGWLVVETASTQLAAPQMGPGYSIGVLRGRLPDGSWAIAGVCSPLATVAYQLGGILNWVAPSLSVQSLSDASVTLNTTSSPWRVNLVLRPIAEPSRIACTTRLGALSDIQVARLGGPTLLAGEGSFGERKTTALLPGIEWLEGEQHSSDVTVVGEGVGYRPLPAPFQLTVPLVAVEADGLLTGLMWAPLQDWGDEGMPMAEFASPNFLDGQANQLCSAFVPGWPAYAAPNQRSAATPLELAAGEALSFETQLYAIGGKTTNDAVPLWYAAYGQPEPPTLVRPLMDYVGLIGQCWGQTCYYPELDKFVNHWRVGQAPFAAPGLKAQIYATYLWTGDDRWITKVGLKPGTDLFSLTGEIASDFGLGEAPAQIASQEANGSWLYHVTEEVRKRSEEFTGGKRHDLGEEGTSSSGLIATKAVGVIAHALATGNPVSIEASLKALEAIRRYKVPAGSQTWEVHKDTPDIYGAALLTDCFRMGYELTGDKSYLDDAVYWARTGLPFLYSYQVPGTSIKGATCVIPGDSLTEGPDPLEGAHTSDIAFENPDRELTPYGSIPVFGTSFYVVNWMGNLVQWCGLVWVSSVQSLLRYVDDPLLEKAAWGTLVSGCHQTFDKEPLVGLLPDTWHLGSNTAYPALISVARLENPVLSALGLKYPQNTQLVVLRAEGRAPVRLATQGAQSDALLSASGLSWTENYAAGAECEAALLGIAAVTSVKVDGQALPQVEALPLTGPSWYLDASTKRLFIRLRHLTEEVRVEVGW